MNELRISFPFGTFGRRLVAEISGGGSGGAGGSPAEINTFAYDLFGNRLSESNSVSSVTYQRDTYGNCTNETTIVAGGLQSSAAAETYTIDREFDAHGRLVRHGDTYYTYAPDGRLTTISNAEAVVEYAYTSDRLDAGYTLTLTNGTVFSRSVVRDAYQGNKIMFIAGISMSAIDVYRAEHRVREVVRQVGGWGGAYVGGRIGSALGVRAGMATAIAIGQAGPQITTPEEVVTVPVFGVIGGIGWGIVGGISGFVFGAKSTETVYDWVFTPLEKEEWEVGCENK